MCICSNGSLGRFPFLERLSLPCSVAVFQQECSGCRFPVCPALVCVLRLRLGPPSHTVNECQVPGGSRPLLPAQPPSSWWGSSNSLPLDSLPGVHRVTTPEPCPAGHCHCRGENPWPRRWFTQHPELPPCPGVTPCIPSCHPNVLCSRKKSPTWSGGGLKCWV